VTVDRLTRTVREQVALGRLLPLGGPDDAAWIAERAAVRSLRRICAALPGVRLGSVAIVLGGVPVDASATDTADPADTVDPVGSAAGVAGHSADSPAGAGRSDGHGVVSSAGGFVPEAPSAAPLGALPHVPLRIEADFEAAMGEPLPQLAERLRDALWAAAEGGLGLAVEAVDLRVTGLLDDETPPPPVEEAEQDPEVEMGPAMVQGTTEAVKAAVRAVPGVLRLTRRLAGLGSLRIRDTQAPGVPGRRVQLQIATAPAHLPLAVARDAAAAVTAAAAPGAPGPVTTAVVVTDVGWPTYG
jgi:hypothetical protein